MREVFWDNFVSFTGDIRGFGHNSRIDGRVDWLRRSDRNKNVRVSELKHSIVNSLYLGTLLKLRGSNTFFLL
jgi:hypothetical protein